SDVRFVEAGLSGVVLGERRDHVRAGDLAARRYGVVIGTPPARDAASDASVDVDVRAERDGEHREGVIEVVEPDPDERARLIGDGPDVGVLAVAALAEELEGDADQIVDRVRKRNTHDPAGAVEPGVVLL